MLDQSQHYITKQIKLKRRMSCFFIRGKNSKLRFLVVKIDSEELSSRNLVKISSTIKVSLPTIAQALTCTLIKNWSALDVFKVVNVSGIFIYFDSKFELIH